MALMVVSEGQRWSTRHSTSGANGCQPHLTASCWLPDSYSLAIYSP